MSTALFNDFIQAQNTVYPSVIKELTEGQKRTHWMWFIFPQVKGLGRSTKTPILIALPKKNKLHTLALYTL